MGLQHPTAVCIQILPASKTSVGNSILKETVFMLSYTALEPMCEGDVVKIYINIGILFLKKYLKRFFF